MYSKSNNMNLIYHIFPLKMTKEISESLTTLYDLRK